MENISNRGFIIFWFAFQFSFLHLLFRFSSANNISAFFIFGDSMVDAGNNYYISTIAKAQFPNGIDFKIRPSGRFSNARTIADTIEQRLGLNFSLPFMAPNTTGDVILKGVNYASSGSGIQTLTGMIWLGFINLNTQISNYEKTRQDIIKIIGLPAASRLLREESIFMIATGSNDIAVSFLMKDLTDRENYLNNLVSVYKDHLTRLYTFDARKIAVTNVGPTGCIPFQREFNPDVAGCDASTNQAVQSYNNKLKAMLEDLTAELEGSSFVYVNQYAAVEDIIQNHKLYGFDNADSACCHMTGGTSHGGQIPCFPGSKVCRHRSKYAFWDTFHLTDAANLIAAKHFVDGGTKFSSPINLRQLAYG